MTIEPGDPVARLLRAPGTLARLAALVLGGVALFLPAIHTVTEYHSGGVSVLYVLPLGWLFPAAIALAVITSVVMSIRGYTRLVDLIAAIAGVVSIALLLPAFLRELQTVEQGRQALQQYNPDATWGANLDIGAIALAISTAIMAVLVVAGRVRRTA